MNRNRLLSLVKTLGLWAGGLAVMAGILMYLTGFFSDKVAPDKGPSHVDSVVKGSPVDVESVLMPVVERYPGTLAAVRTAAISARIIARVREIRVRPGQAVAADEALVLLDSRDLEARFARTEEDLNGARAIMAERQANFERMKSASTGGAVSQKELDIAKAAADGAKANFESMQQRLEEARIALSYATITAPFAANVIDRMVEPGDLASPGRPLLELYDPSRMRLEAWVREALAISLKPGDSVTVQLDSQNEKLAGTVEEIVPQAEAGSRSFLVKVKLPQNAGLYPGMFGRLLLQANSVQRIFVPAAALARIGQLTFVVMSDGKYTRRMVVPGESMDDGKVEILSGLKLGEAVIIPE